MLPLALSRRSLPQGIGVWLKGASASALWSPFFGRCAPLPLSLLPHPQPRQPAIRTLYAATPTSASPSIVVCTSFSFGIHAFASPCASVKLASQGESSTGRRRPRGGRNRRRQHQGPYSHIQVVRNNDTPSSRARGGNNPENLFRYIPSDNEVTSLRTTRPFDTTQSSAVASGTTFADIARSGIARAPKSDPIGQRSSSGLMKMRPKQKNWKPLDLGGLDKRSPLTGRSDASTPIESDSVRDDFAPDSAISKTFPDNFSEIPSRDTSLPPMTCPEPRVQTMAFAESSNAQKQDLDEISSTFGQRLPDPVWLRANEGKSSGQVKFIQHPSRDVTAHRWSADNFEWQEIGRYSCNRKFMDGHVISPVFLQHIEANPLQHHSLKYFAKLASDYSGFVKSRSPSIDSTRSIYAPRPSHTFNTSLHEPARYDSLSSVTSSHQVMGLPSLVTLSLANRPAVMQAARPVQTNPQNMHLHGLGAAEDDPFTESISPRNTRAFIPSPDALRRSNLVQNNPTMDFAFRFPPPGMLNRQRDESVYDMSDWDDMSVMSSDRRAFFAEQERKRTEQMRQSVLNPNAYSDSQAHVQGFQSMQTQQKHEYPTDSSVLYSQQMGHDVYHEPLTAVFASQEYQPIALSQRGGGPTYNSITDESRARMREYLNRTTKELASHDTSYMASAEPVRSDSSDPMCRPLLEYSAKKSLAPPRIDRPPSSISQVSRSALRTSDPDYRSVPSTAPIYNAFNNQATVQEFNGPFFEDVQPTTTNPGVFRSIHKSQEEELEEWWTSGSTYQRQKEYLDSLYAAGVGHGSSAVTNQLLISLYERLRSYVRDPGTKPKPEDYFSPFGKPPDWCIDRSRGCGNDSFFGEDYGGVPKRIGRDPRFKPNFGNPFSIEPPSQLWPKEESFSFNANPGGAAALGGRFGSSAHHIRY